MLLGRKWFTNSAGEDGQASGWVVEVAPWMARDACWVWASGDRLFMSLVRERAGLEGGGGWRV